MSIKCKNPGCGKDFIESENIDTSCAFHPGGPSFRDGKKVWMCCGESHWDWEGFMGIQGCTKGSHSSFVKPKVVVDNTPAPAPIPAPVSIDIPVESATVVNVPMVPLILPSGKFRCAHAGCGKEFGENEQNDVCEYHPGQPIFRDVKKEWNCCGANSYDWDDFTKLPKCAKGHHEKKLVKS